MFKEVLKEEKMSKMVYLTDIELQSASREITRGSILSRYLMTNVLVYDRMK